MGAHKHGREYLSWKGMIQRCTNPNYSKSKDYMGRGITVEDYFLGPDGFQHFFDYMGKRPAGKSLDRYPDNDDGYIRGNMRWATSHEQRINSRPISCGLRRQRWFYGHGPNGEMVIENSQGRVARVFGLDGGCVSRCLHKHYGYKTVRGWKFQWI